MTDKLSNVVRGLRCQHPAIKSAWTNHTTAVIDKLFRSVSRGCSCQRPSSTTSNGPLEGVTVLDMTRLLAGPTCTMVLADYGAKVIKIEDPKTGDITRSWSPFLHDSRTSCYYAALNRGKRSVCVNFKTAEGRELLHNLAKKCDILVENFVPGVLRKYALDYDSVKSIAPTLIYCSLTGFGSEGPYTRKPGVDLIAASMGGHLSMTGPEDGEPCRTGISAIDIMTGLHLTTAMLAALFEQKRTGRGRKIDANLFTTALATMEHYAIASLNLGVEPKRLGTEHMTVVPYKSFKSKDGYFTCGAVSDSQFKKMCEILDVPELYADERFSSCAKRAQRRKELHSILSRKFVQKSTMEWCDTFADSSLPHGPLNTVGQVSPHFLHQRVPRDGGDEDQSRCQRLANSLYVSDVKSIDTFMMIRQLL